MKAHHPLVGTEVGDDIIPQVIDNAINTYRARTINSAKGRRRRNQAQIEQLDRQIVAVLAADHPQSVRHAFYRMTDPTLPEPVEKSDRGYRHVQDRIVKLRRARAIPYGWITDSTRRGHFTDTFSGAAEFLTRVAGLYRADLWRQAAVHCEVWTESRSIAGVIEEDCRELAVSLYPAGGFTSITLAYQAAESINATHRDEPVVIFYVGDYDPAGVLIDVKLEEELRRHLDCTVDLHFTRLAITPEQIEEHRLPRNYRKAGDKRSLHVEHTVEAEAMPAHVLRKIVRGSVEALLPPDALRVAQVAERSERDFLMQLASTIAGGAA